MSTLYVNLYGAPGAGKSTGASWIFSRLKLMGIDCEYVQEFAKDMVWENNRFIFDDPDNQLVIFANQFYRLNRVNGKVNVAVTDSPLPLSLLYLKGSLLDHDDYKQLVIRMSHKFNSMNFLINRTKPYNPNGRNQDEEASNQLSRDIVGILDQLNLLYERVDGNENGYTHILNRIIRVVKE